jgi:cytoskeleton protein RodZ
MAGSDERIPSAPPEGPGERLRLGRENRGLSAAEVADALHLDRAMIAALEADDYDNLPPATFTKGYLRAYARYLGLNEDVLLASYERLGQGDQTRPLTPAVGRSGGMRRWRKRWLLLTGLLVAAGGGAAVVTLTDTFVSDWVRDTAQSGVDTMTDYAAGEATVEPDDAAAPAAGGDDTPANQGEDTPSAAAGSDGVDDSRDEAPEQAGADTDETDEGSSTGTESGPSAPQANAEATANARPDGDDTALPGSTDSDNTSTRTLLEGDPLGGGESLLGGEDMPVTGDEAAAEDFGGPLGEAAPQPGRGGEASASTDPTRQGADAMGPEATETASQDGAPVGDGTPATSSTQEPDPVATAGTVEQPGNGGEALASPSGEDTVAEATIELSFTGQSWMEIRDARGRRLLFELITEPGERRVAGVPPFELVVGDVDNVSVRYNGESVDLKQYSRQGMARLELGGS